MFKKPLPYTIKNNCNNIYDASVKNNKSHSTKWAIETETIYT